MSVKDSSFYDARFRSVKKYLVPPRNSIYYPLWRTVLNKLKPGCNILDVGCGPGQFARLCVDEGHQYVGIDFSKVAIERGRKKVPEAVFHLVNVVKDKSLLKKGNYDTVTLIEFLEHIEEDLEVLSSIPEGKNIVLTVPKHWSKSHVRVFETGESVSHRYGKLLKIKDLDEIALGRWIIYVLSGEKQ